MTDSQARYHNLIESQRHNLAMERLGSQENRLKAAELEVSKQRAATAQMEAETKRRASKVENTMRTVNTAMGILGAVYPHTLPGKLESFGDQILSGMAGSTRTAVNASLFA